LPILALLAGAAGFGYKPGVRRHSIPLMPLRIATWNINSIRLRLDTVRRFIAGWSPDVLCLQETKTRNPGFPREELAAQGYRHALIHGMKSYNGVAMLSRVPFTAKRRRNWCGRRDCRHLVAELPGGLELHNFYVPAGGDVPDPAANPKFAHKLQFLEEMAARFAARPHDAGRQLMLVGDLNVAPLETDVWSHKQLLKVVSHTPVEVERLARVAGALQWVDAVRRFVPAEQKVFSWWSYRARDWAASDRGRRLDHIWVTPALAPALVRAEVVKEARGWDLPSDHVPVLVDLG
jgi:exodeoxyribonuclease III